jgi:site-specific recombinase XerD
VFPRDLAAGSVVWEPIEIGIIRMVFSELAMSQKERRRMLEEFFERLATDKRSRGNPLVVQLSPFAASLKENGYAVTTMRSKLSLLVDFGQWLGRSGLAVTELDERVAETFFSEKRRKGRVHRGNRETVRQLLDHLRERNVVPGVKPTRDRSPLADILDRYEKHLRSERGVATATGAHVHCQGKGRKHRCTPLRPETAKVLEAWLRERRGRPEDPLFLSIRGGKLSRDAIERLITKYTALAGRTCALLKRKKISPHVLRHATAMDLLQNGVDRL